MKIISTFQNEEAILDLTQEDLETIKNKLYRELSNEYKGTFSTDKAKFLVDLYRYSNAYLGEGSYSHYTCKIISECLGVKIL